MLLEMWVHSDEHNHEKGQSDHHEDSEDVVGTDAFVMMNAMLIPTEEIADERANPSRTHIDHSPHEHVEMHLQICWYLFGDERTCRAAANLIRTQPDNGTDRPYYHVRDVVVFLLEEIKEENTRHERYDEENQHYFAVVKFPLLHRRTRG